MVPCQANVLICLFLDQILLIKSYFDFRLEKHIENCHGPNAKKRKMKNGKPKTYPIPQYKGEPGKIPCPHCNRPLADEKQLESHIKRFIFNIILSYT